jgi:hypothetical protein
VKFSNWIKVVAHFLFYFSALFTVNRCKYLSNIYLRIKVGAGAVEVGATYKNKYSASQHCNKHSIRNASRIFLNNNLRKYCSFPGKTYLYIGSTILYVILLNKFGSLLKILSKRRFYTRECAHCFTIHRSSNLIWVYV